MDYHKLPAEVLKNIISYKSGAPEYNKIKYNHNKTLERIQRRYKINRTEPEIKTTLHTNIGGIEKTKRQIIQYKVSRNVPFSVESLEDILNREADELDCLLDEYCDENMDDFIIFVKARVRIRYHHFVYDYIDSDGDEFEFSLASCIYCSDDTERSLNFLEDIPYAMNEAFTEITNEMDELRDEGDILGIDSFRFKLIINTPYQ